MLAVRNPARPPCACATPSGTTGIAEMHTAHGTTDRSVPGRHWYVRKTPLMRSFPKLPLIVSTLCLPLALLTGCPGDDTGDDGATPTTSSDDTTTTTDGTPPPPDTDTDPVPPDTDTDPVPPDTDTDPVPPDTDTDTDPLPPDTDTDTDGRVTGCECIPDDVNKGNPDTPSSPTCGEALCPDVSLSCSGYCSDGEAVLDDAAALECALTALRDRTPGLVTWSWRENVGQYEDDGYVLVNADGTAVRRNWGWSDLEYEASSAVLGELPPPEHFDACLAEADDNARFECLRGALGPSIETCDEGWYYSKF